VSPAPRGLSWRVARALHDTGVIVERAVAPAARNDVEIGHCESALIRDARFRASPLLSPPVSGASCVLSRTGSDGADVADRFVAWFAVQTLHSVEAGILRIWLTYRLEKLS
jgi:hypothetical protein